MGPLLASATLRHAKASSIGTCFLRISYRRRINRKTTLTDLVFVVLAVFFLDRYQSHYSVLSLIVSVSKHSKDTSQLATSLGTFP